MSMGNFFAKSFKKPFSFSVELITGPTSKAEFTIKFYSYATYEKAFKNAGFVNFQWKEVVLSEEERKQNPDFWKHFSPTKASIIGFKALKKA